MDLGLSFPPMNKSKENKADFSVQPTASKTDSYPQEEGLHADIIKRMDNGFKLMADTLTNVLLQNSSHGLKKGTSTVTKRKVAAANEITINSPPQKKLPPSTISSGEKVTENVTEQPVDNDDAVSVMADSDTLQTLLDSSSESEDEESSTQDVMDKIMEQIEGDHKKGPAIDSKLAGIIKGIWTKSLEEDNLKNKFEQYQTPANCESLQTKKCNTEIWSYKLDNNHRSNDLKIQKIQNSVLKSTLAVTALTDSILKLHRNKELSSKELRKELGNIIPMSMDALHFNAHSMHLGDQLRRHRITQLLDVEIRGIGKNVDETSDMLFGNDLPKRLTEIKNNQKALFSKSKNENRSPKIPRDLYNRQGYNHSRHGYQNRFKQPQHFKKHWNRFKKEKNQKESGKK